MKILILDNYDSFTFNLSHYLEGLGAEVDVRRNDAIELRSVEDYDKVVLSPGPGLPHKAGIMPELVASFAGRIPILGVCLGHQCVAEHFGAKLYNLPEVIHGRPSSCIQVLDDVLFNGLSKSFKVGHYHSWAVSEKEFPDSLEVTAINDQGIILAIRHRTMDIRGVQFHPESILTEGGREMLRNWLLSS